MSISLRSDQAVGRVLIKISALQNLTQFNFNNKQRKRFFRPVLWVSPVCACPMQKNSLAIGKRGEVRLILVFITKNKSLTSLGDYFS